MQLATCHLLSDWGLAGEHTRAAYWRRQLERPKPAALAADLQLLCGELQRCFGDLGYLPSRADLRAASRYEHLSCAGSVDTALLCSKLQRCFGDLSFTSGGSALWYSFSVLLHGANNPHCLQTSDLKGVLLSDWRQAAALVFPCARRHADLRWPAASPLLTALHHRPLEPHPRFLCNPL